MQFVKELAGGVLIILVSGVIGIAQNAVREDSVSLVPAASRAMGTRGESPQTVSGKSATPRSQTPAGAGDSTGDSLTDEELASGELDKDRLRDLITAGTIIVVDARSGEEFDDGHITGAVNIPYDELLDYYDRLKSTIPTDAVVVCYCASVTCDQSENLANELAFMGYANVLVYKGGWEEWKAAGYPVE